MNTKKFSWGYLSLARFLLAFVVMCGHLAEFTPNLGPLKPFYLMGSFEAVLGFLLISGFSIGKSIQRNQRDYFKRRFQRIYPVYIASIALVFFVKSPLFSSETLLTLFWNLVFLNQIVTPTSFVGQAWSLALEVWLYCLAPFLFKTSRQWLRLFIWVSFFCFSVYEGGRILFDWKYFSRIGFGLDLLLLSFVWVAGFAYSLDKQFRKDIAWSFGGYLFLLSAFKFIHYFDRHQLSRFFTDYSAHLLFAAILLALVFVVVVHNKKLPRVSQRADYWFDLLGNVSYPLYLTHYALLRLLSGYSKPTWYSFPLLALFVAAIFYFTFDFYSQKRAKKCKKQVSLQPVLLKEAM